MKKAVVFVFIVFLVQGIGFAQNKKMDSLNVELKKANKDTTRLRIYLALCDECEVNDNPIYAEPAINIIDKLLSNLKEEKVRISYLKKKATAYQFLIDYYNDKDDMKKLFNTYQKVTEIMMMANDTVAIQKLTIKLSLDFTLKGNTPADLKVLEKGLAITSKLNYKKGIANIIGAMGKMYFDNGDTTQAIINYEKAFKLSEEINYREYLANLTVAMGEFYGKAHKVEKSVYYFNKALLLNNKYGMAMTYQYKASMYSENNQFTEALNNYQTCFHLLNGLNTREWAKSVLVEIGTLYRKYGNIEKAIEYHKRALSLAKEISSESAYYDCNSALAIDYCKLKDYKLAKYYFEPIRGFKGLKNINALYFREKMAAEIDSASGNVSSAYEHFKQAIIYRDKLKNDEIHIAATKEKYQREYDEQKKAVEAEQEKKDAIANAESKKQKLIILSFGLGLLLVLVFAGFVFHSLRIRNKQNKIITAQKGVVEKQKHLVEVKNHEITQSIQYALRIQTAILPPQKIVKQYLENSFILYKPKDIVAGDFYWMEAPPSLPEGEEQQPSKSQQQEDIGVISSPSGRSGGAILFAACDCTGHGVPGAMVSVVCHNALNRAVREFGLTKPSEILDKTAEIVIENFSKSEENIKDGMDISLACIKYNEQSTMTELQWAGANNPLWIVRNNQQPTTNNQQLEEIRADKQPIGMNEDSKPFTNHTIALNSGDTIYLFTDGFADQFGGETGEKKLTRKRFKEVLLSIQHLSLTEQGIQLDKFITEYRKEVEQIDDILVMGVRV